MQIVGSHKEFSGVQNAFSPTKASLMGDYYTRLQYTKSEQETVNFTFNLVYITKTYIN